MEQLAGGCRWNNLQGIVDGIILQGMAMAMIVGHSDGQGPAEDG